jgi:hypothetical protein
MTARSADDPVAISVEVSMIGWVKLKVTAGNSARRREGVGALFVAPRLGHDHPHLGRLEDQLAEPRGGLGRGIERDAGRQVGPDPDHPFVQGWEELDAEPGAQPDGTEHDQRRQQFTRGVLLSARSMGMVTCTRRA